MGAASKSCLRGNPKTGEATPAPIRAPANDKTGARETSEHALALGVNYLMRAINACRHLFVFAVEENSVRGFRRISGTCKMPFGEITPQLLFLAETTRHTTVVICIRMRMLDEKQIQ